MSDDTIDQPPADGAPPADDWRSHIPADLKDAPSLKDFKGIGGLAKAYVDLKAFAGTSIRIPSASADDATRAAFKEKLKNNVPDLLQLPAEDAPPEAWDEVFTRLGAGDKYDLPDNFGHLAQLPEMAKAAKLTKRQWASLVEHAATAHRLTQEQSEMKMATYDAELKSAWGISKDSKVARILRMTELHGAPKEFHEAVHKGVVPPAMLRFLDKVADQLDGEGGELSNTKANVNAARMTPDMIQREIQDVLANKEYWDSGSPRHEYLKKRMFELQSMATAS